MTNIIKEAILKRDNRGTSYMADSLLGKPQMEAFNYKECKKLLIECIQADVASFFNDTGGMPDLPLAKQYIDYLVALEKHNGLNK